MGSTIIDVSSRVRLFTTMCDWLKQKPVFGPAEARKLLKAGLQGAGFGARRQAGVRIDVPTRSGPTRRRLVLPMEPDCIYAVGDIHGCIDKLQGLEQAIIEDAKSVDGSKLLVFLGDYVDRGPDSAAVIDHLLSPKPEGFQRVCLAGNHEAVLVDVLDGIRSFDDWLELGGESTLLSYSYDLRYLSKGRQAGRAERAERALEAIPNAHMQFLRRLPASFSTPDYFFAHAGARPGIALEDQSERDLMWIRESFLNAPASDFGRMVVHGHTPARRPFLGARRIGVDTGAYMGGPLTAARIIGSRVDFVSYG